MPTARAEKELLAPPEDVWTFLAEPHHLADWWPEVAAVEPDRRGLSSGARWVIRRGGSPGLLRRPGAESMLLVREVDPMRLVRWHLTGERLDVELELEPEGRDHTHARLSVTGPLMLAFRRSLPQDALERLHSLVQTAATL